MWGQASAGLIAGLPLAFMATALLTSLFPLETATKFALVVVFGPTLYCATITAAFATASGLRAWVSMLVANLLAAALLYIAVQLGGYGVPQVAL